MISFWKYLQASLFGAIRLLGSRVRSRGRRFIGGRVLLVTGDCPPAVLELRQLAHLRAMFHSGLVRAMAVAQRRRGPGTQRRRSLVGESGSRKTPQQDCHANRLPESTGARCHAPILRRVVLKTDSAEGGKLLVFRV